MNSLTIPDHYVLEARSRAIVVVAGANQGRKYRKRLEAGLGTAERPLRETQSIEAAMALASRAGLDSPMFHIWGYGHVLEPDRDYIYEARGRAQCRIRRLGVDRVSADGRPNYTRRALVSDARRLLACVSSLEDDAGVDVVVVGCSWGAAVIDVALDPASGAPCRTIGVALGSPQYVLSISPGLGFHALRPSGDYGNCWIQRHPDDQIGRGRFGPLAYWLSPGSHDYWSPLTDEPHAPKMWGI